MFIETELLMFQAPQERSVGCRSYGAWKTNTTPIYKHFASLWLRKSNRTWFLQLIFEVSNKQ